MIEHSSLARWTPKLPLVFFATLLIVINNLYSRFFPNIFGLLGHDFSLSNPALLDGAFWFWKNGISAIPWFTPSFCGGQLFFADPQSVYYSPIQWLAFFLPPTQASHVALLVALSMGYWSFYFLARGVFQLSVQSSILAGALAMLNGFVPYRFILGEIGYQAFLLTGFVAHALLSKQNWRIGFNCKFGNIFWAGLAIAFMLNSGLTTLMIPAAFGVLVVGIAARLSNKGASFTIFMARGIVACIFALCLCASKILASATFMSHFPREAYALPGFPSLSDAILLPVYSLFLHSQTVWNIATPKMVNSQWTVYPHEWAYGFGFIFLVYLLIGTGLYLRNRLQSNKIKNTFTPRAKTLTLIASITSLMVILMLPSAILWYSPEWNAVLKSIPIINTTSFPFRWIIIWIPLCCIIGSIIWQSIEQRMPSIDAAWLGLIILLAGILIESTVTDKSYYIDPKVQGYDPTIIDNAWSEGKSGNIPDIGKLTDYDYPHNFNRPNESLVFGESFIHCYNPAYGYRQETLPLGRLRADQLAMSAHEDYLNIKNPACLIWPDANKCETIGAEYKASESELAYDFITRKPISFRFSQPQKIANYINIFALILTITGLIFSLLSLCIDFFTDEKRK